MNKSAEKKSNQTRVSKIQKWGNEISDVLNTMQPSFDGEKVYRHITSEEEYLELNYGASNDELDYRYVFCLTRVINILKNINGGEKVDKLISKLNKEIGLKKFDNVYNRVSDGISNDVDKILNQSLYLTYDLQDTIEVFAEIEMSRIANRQMEDLLSLGNEMIEGFIDELNDSPDYPEKYEEINQKRKEFLVSFTPKLISAFQKSYVKLTYDVDIFEKIAILLGLPKNDLDYLGFIGLKEEIEHASSYINKFDIIERLTHMIASLNNITNELSKSLRYSGIIIGIKNDLDFFNETFNSLADSKIDYSEELLIQISERYIILLDWISRFVSEEDSEEMGIKDFVTNVLSEIRGEFSGAHNPKLNDLSSLTYLSELDIR